jgi:hypothetical protein
MKPKYIESEFRKPVNVLSSNSAPDGGEYENLNLNNTTLTLE